MAVCFISYAQRPLDQKVVAYVRQLLDRAGVSYWWDGMIARREPGGGVNEEIGGELDRAQVVIAIVSSQTLASSYCQAEVNYALAHNKQVIRIDAEQVLVPPALLPLAAVPAVLWYDTVPATFGIRLAEALAAKRVDASKGLEGGASADAANVLFGPGAAIIRPPYLELRAAGPDLWQEYVRRLNQAAMHSPHNGYNHLSLAFLWLVQRDAARALVAARKALDQLEREPDAHYAEALALCIQSPPAKRSKSDVEAILRRLAIARRLPDAGAHIDLLTALIIANYYLPNYLTPPAIPDQLLRSGLERRLDRGEAMRVLDVEPLCDGRFRTAETAALIASYISPEGGR